MTMIADVLLVAGALGAALYCFVLSRRLRRFTDLEKGVGGAVAILSVQVDDLNRTLTSAQSSARESAEKLQRLSKQAEVSRERLELMLASLHDVPSTLPETEEISPFFVRRPAIKEPA